MTIQQMGSLSAEIRRVRGRCLQRADVFERWLKANPDVNVHEARQYMASIGDSPFPPIHGPKPKEGKHDFFDARFEGEWKNDDV